MKTHLPEKIADWPDDPFRLLGIEQGADERSAKRAYTKLVRCYKPDHAPEEFQRIRAAYEIVLTHLRYANLWGEPANQASDDGDSQPAAPTADEPATGSPTSQPAADESAGPAAGGFGTVPQTCPTIWQQAVDGDSAGAYRQLLSLRETQRGDEDICARLYWLLKLDPDLDPWREPVAWLVEGLLANNLSGPLKELYRRELERNPAHIASEQADAILKANAPFAALADLAEWRFRAAGRLNRWDVIESDLDYLRTRTGVDDDRLWSYVLMSAIDQLAWADDSTACQARYDEIEQMVHLHSDMYYCFDRLDFLREVVEGWQRLQLNVHVPIEWARLVPLSWSRGFWEIRDEVLPVLRKIAAEPTWALGRFDEMCKCSPAVAAQFGSLAESCYGSLADQYDIEPDDETLQRVIRAAIWQSFGAGYSKLRLRLLKLCLEYAVHPYDAARIADQTPGFFLAGGQPVVDAVTDDGPIRYVYAACRAF